MKLIDEIHTKTPFYGSRKITEVIRLKGHEINRKRVQNLMRKMGLNAIYPGPNTSKRRHDHRIYPYLLKGVEIEELNQKLIHTKKELSLKENDLAKQIRELTSEKTQINEALIKSKNNEKSLSNQASTLHQRLSEANAKLEMSEKALQEQTQKIKKEKTSLEQRLNETKESMTPIKKRLKTLESELQSSKNTLTSKEKEWVKRIQELEHSKLLFEKRLKSAGSNENKLTQSIRDLGKQLAVGGRMVVPVGDRSVQSLSIYDKTESGMKKTSVGDVIFVPLIGSSGGWEK